MRGSFVVGIGLTHPVFGHLPAPLGEVADAARRTPLPALRPSAGPGNRLLFPAAFALLVLIAASGSFLSLAYRIRRGDRS